MTVLDIARLFRFVREASANAGQRVEAIQKWCGGLVGESWCCYFVTMVLDLFFHGKSPIPRMGSCQAVLDLATAKGWLTDAPVAGDLVISVNAVGHAHHIAFAEASVSHGTLPVLAGNTSEDGLSSNGTGVFSHVVPTAGKKFVHYPR